MRTGIMMAAAFAVLLAAPLAAQDVAEHLTDYDKALEKAKESNKYLLVDWWAPW